jgi:hypothetical protein
LFRHIATVSDYHLHPGQVGSDSLNRVEKLFVSEERLDSDGNFIVSWLFEKHQLVFSQPSKFSWIFLIFDSYAKTSFDLLIYPCSTFLKCSKTVAACALPSATRLSRKPSISPMLYPIVGLSGIFLPFNF